MKEKDGFSNIQTLQRQWAFSIPTRQENCPLLGADNAREQISEHTFAPNGGYRLLILAPNGGCVIK